MSTLKRAQKKDKDVYEVELEKVLPGKAVCVLNMRAPLTLQKLHLLEPLEKW